MTGGFADAETKAALVGAVKSIELRSDAEVLVAVRERVGTSDAPLKAAILAAVAVLVFLVFSPWPFRLPWFVIDPILCGAIAAWIAHRTSVFERVLVPRSQRERAARHAAAALFLEKKLHLTRRRTGLLVYLALRERVAVVVADSGIQSTVDEKAWTDAVSALDTAMARGEAGTQVATRVSALGAALAVVGRRGDVNEVPDEVVYL